MGQAQLDFSEIRRNIKDRSARRQEKSLNRVKRSYWSMLKSDERLLRANAALRRAHNRLRAAGMLPEEPKPEPDPDLAWGNLLINGIKNPKRRADD